MSIFGMPKLNNLFKHRYQDEPKLQMPTGWNDQTVQELVAYIKKTQDEPVLMKHHNSDVRDDIGIVSYVTPNYTWIDCSGTGWRCSCSVADDAEFCPCGIPRFC